ncbi:MAG: uridine phosphorylase [Anaerolinea sp.]|nr:uridine phosphorylase [Anaerolinea sp.]
MKSTWYLGVDADFVADRAILVGDPGRVELFAERLADVAVNGGERALRTVTGTHHGRRVTVCSFGMGAPIAVVVLEELAWLGVRTVLRAGTVMSLGGIELGTLVLADAALRGEATSATYLPPDGPALADPALLACAAQVLSRSGVSYRRGIVASYDGFYSQLFALREERRAQVEALTSGLRARDAIAVDMETSALLAVAPLLGVRAASLCLASVDGSSHARLESVERVDGERRLVETALEIISQCEPEEP